MYILEINPLSVVSFAIIFSPSEGSLFTLLIVYFAVQKLLSLIMLRIKELQKGVFLVSITVVGWFLAVSKGMETLVFELVKKMNKASC